MAEYDFSGKTVLITGAASGMGLLSSRTFASYGAAVAMVDVNKEELDKYVEEIKADGGKAVGIICDVRKYEEVAEACKTAYDTFGSIDILINLAGGSATRVFQAKGKDFPDVPIEVYEWGIDVNFKGPFYFSHAVSKYMRDQKSGVIVNIGSITGEEGSNKSADYAASKTGVMYGLTKSLAIFGAQYGIRAVCVSPGPVLTRPAMAKMKTMMGRAAEPKEIVDIIVFLASDKASFVTGVNLLADGGRLLAEDRTWG